MTRRKTLYPKRLSRSTLEANEELAAVAYRGWWAPTGSDRRSWWQGISAVHGARLLDKWIDCCPGTRPAFWWIVSGPELELLAEPDTLDGQRAWVEVSGTRYWYAGPPWQRRQVDVLREIGEVDAQEYRHYRAWISGGASFAYPVEDGGWICRFIYPGVSRQEVLCHGE